MRTIPLMGRISLFPNIIILGTTHPAPLFTTSHRSRRTLYMITPIHFLNPSPAKTRFRVVPQPRPRFGIGSKLQGTEMIQVLGTVDSRMSGCAAMETGFKVTCRTCKVGREFYQ